MNARRVQPSRRGSVFVLLTVLIIVFFAVTALAVDLGYAIVGRSEIQNGADAAVMAGASFLILDRDLLKGAPDQTAEITAAQLNARVYTRANASHFSGLDQSSGSESNSKGVSISVNNSFTIAGTENVIGYLADPNDTTASMQTNSGSLPSFFSPPVLFYVPPIAGDYSSATPQLVGRLPMPKRTPPAVSELPDVEDAATSVLAPPAVNITYNNYNAVQFTVSRTEDSPNGALDVFFARVMPGNLGKVDIATKATATWEDNIKGFRIRTNSGGTIVGPNTCKLLPFAMDINTFAAMAAGMSTIDLYVYDPDGGPVTKPVYPGTPPDYQNRLTMSNGYLDWLIGDTAGIPYDSLTVASLKNWDKLDPLNVYNRSDDFLNGALKSAGANPPGKLFPRPDLSPRPSVPPSSFNPFASDVYSGLLPGDGIKEAVLVPLTLQRREFPDDLDDVLNWNLFTTALTIVNRLSGIQATQSIAKSDVHVGNFGCLYLGTSASQGIVDYFNDVPTELTEFKRQILYGLNQTDFNQMEGRLALNESGYVTVRGSTMVPSTLKSTLLSIRGQPRIIALYEPTTTNLLPENPTGAAMEADYKIVGFAGIIVLEVIEIPEPRSIDRAGNAYDRVFDYLNSPSLNWLQSIPLVGAKLTAILAAENAVLAQPNSIKVLIQPEFVIDYTAIGGGSKLSIPAGRKTSAFVYKPLVITR